jgi:hypothetical protein
MRQIRRSETLRARARRAKRTVNHLEAARAAAKADDAFAGNTTGAEVEAQSALARAATNATLWLEAALGDVLEHEVSATLGGPFGEPPTRTVQDLAHQVRFNPGFDGAVDDAVRRLIARIEKDAIPS